MHACSFCNKNELVHLIHNLTKTQSSSFSRVIKMIPPTVIHLINTLKLYNELIKLQYIILALREKIFMYEKVGVV